MTVLGLVGCGGSKPPAKEPVSTSNFDEVEERECIKLANMPREPDKYAPAQIDISQIIVQYAGKADAGSVTRTRGEACVRAQQVRRQLLAKADWDELYDEYSDKKDDARGIQKGATQKSLGKKIGNAAFGLSVNDLSHVVETEQGFHIIWRSE